MLTTLGLGAVLLLSACGGGTSSGGTGSDSTPPSLTITSQETASSVTYHLTGTVSDDVGVDTVSYTVNGDEPREATVTEGAFDVTLTLRAGDNAIRITVSDAAGNEITRTHTVTYTPAGGASLTIEVTGLPSGVAASVTVEDGGGYSRSLDAGATLAGLEPGTYTFTVNDATSEIYTYTGSASQGSIDLTAGDDATVTIDYQPIDGALDLTIDGLPAGTPAQVSLTPQVGSQTRYDESRLIPHVPPGTYTLTAPQLRGTDYELYALPSPSVTVTVRAGVTTQRGVSFEQVSGDLEITITPVAGGDVTVNQPGLSYHQGVAGSTTLMGLYAATTGTVYYLTPADVREDGYDWTADGTTVTVQRRATADATVTYTATNGALHVTVSNPGAAVAGDVDVTTLAGDPILDHVTSEATAPYLDAGTYHVWTHAVTDGDYRYARLPYVIDDFNYAAYVYDGRTAQVDVTYGPVTGILAIDVTGIADGAMPDITVTGNGTNVSVDTVTQAVKYLYEGSYGIAAANIRGSRYDYAPNPASQTKAVTPGAETPASVRYVATNGALQIAFSGTIPSGESYSADISDGSVTKTLTRSTAGTKTEAYLAARAYTVTAPSFTIGQCGRTATVTSYIPAVSDSTPVVENGKTRQVSVTYSSNTIDCSGSP